MRVVVESEAVPCAGLRSIDPVKLELAALYRADHVRASFVHGRVIGEGVEMVRGVEPAQGREIEGCAHGQNAALLARARQRCAAGLPAPARLGRRAAWMPR